VARGRLVTAATVVAVAALGAACTVTGTVNAQKPYEHHFTESIGQAPHVVIETFNGRISVIAGGDGAVDARVTSRGSGTSQAAAEADLRNVAVAFEQDGVNVTITARRTDRPVVLGNSGADVEVTVPAGSSLELFTSNGRIEAANVSGSIKAITSNGAITTRGGRELSLDTTNAPISVNNASGRIEVRTSNGPLDIVAAREAEVTAQTSNATLTFSGDLEAGEHEFQTNNGDLTLTLPGDQVFSIEGSTSNGSVRTDFDPEDLTISDTTISGRTGFGRTAAIRATTSNGDLAVMMIRP
jgi:DUF4097 and DUF4098 domain-containing protein YvlB